MLSLAAVVVVIGGIKAAATFVVPLFVAIFLAFLLSPTVRMLMKFGLPKWASVLLVAVVMVAAGLFTTVTLGNSLVQFSRQLPGYVARVGDLERELYIWLDRMGFNIDLQGSALDQNLAPERLMNALLDLLNAVRGLFTNGIIILVLVVFFLLETGEGRRRLTRAFGTDSPLPANLEQYAERLKAYVKVKTWMSLGTGLVVGLSLWALGVDFAVLWGVLAFLLNYVPVIGSLIAAVPPVVLALLEYGVGRAVLVSVIIIVVNNVFSNFIEPRLMGEEFGMPAWIIFAAFLFWAWVLGPVGMLLAVPLTVAIKLTLESFEATKPMATLMGK
jgi:AI-2 transport protein TqsA